MKKTIILLMTLVLFLNIYSNEKTKELNLKLVKGKKWTTKKSFGFMKKFKLQPQMAIWTEDLDGNMLETIYITNKTFNWNKDAKGNLEKQFRKESLPNWGYKRKDNIDIKAGATQKNNLDFNLKSEIKYDLNKFYVYFELNKSFDNNKFFTEKGDKGTIKSGLNGQPSLIYRVLVDLDNKEIKIYNLELYKYSDPMGGQELFDDFEKLTTAKDLVKTITISID